MFRSNPIIDRFIGFFSLPNCYFEIIKLKECKKSRLGIAFDLLHLFFGYKTFPDNYDPCRLWEVKKSNWKFYYGSNYQSHQRARLRRKVQPNEYRVLFDDKAVCERLCSVIGVPMPHTYGIISPLQNYKEKIISYFHNSSEDAFLIKPVLGSAGLGIVLAKRINNENFIQSIEGFIPLEDFVLMENAIVQEVIMQYDRMSVFSSFSLNTIRVVTMFTKKESIIVVSALMRSGVGESYIDNFSAGGVAVGVDCKTGKLEKYGHDKKGNRYVEHPTSKVVFKDFIIPKWERILGTAVKIQKTFPFYRMLGMDIALQQNGEPILIEVNAVPDLAGQEQIAGPLLQNDDVLRAFGEYDLLINKHQKRLYSNLVNSWIHNE